MNTFDWIEIRTRDTRTAAAFYKTILGWELVRMETADGADYWIFDTGYEPRLENLRRVGLWMRPDGADLGIVVYLAVEDVDAVLRPVTDLGGTVVEPKTRQGAAFKAYVRNPDGNLIGLWQE